MEKQVLTVEQMKELIDMGFDVSNACMCWHHYDTTADGLDKYSLGHFRDFHKEAYINKDPFFKGIPTFTLLDVLKFFPYRIECISYGSMPYEFVMRKLGWNITMGYVPDKEAWENDHKDWLDEAPEFWFDEDNPLDSAFNMLKWCRKNSAQWYMKNNITQITKDFE